MCAMVKQSVEWKWLSKVTQGPFVEVIRRMWCMGGEAGGYGLGFLGRGI